MKNLPLTDPSANELLGNAQQPQATSMSDVLRKEIIAGLGTPPPPSGGGGIPPYIPGFDHLMGYNWNWSGPQLTVQTINDAQGPLGPNGIVVFAFTIPANQPLGGIATVAEAPYPGNLQETTRTASISTTAGDFSTSALMVTTSQGIGMSLLVGPFPHRPGMYVELERGKPYFINICTKDREGHSTCSLSGPSCDMRITLTPP